MVHVPSTGARRLEWAGLALLVALGGLAGLALGPLMPFGPGLRDDSYTYLQAAETLAETGTYGRTTAPGEVRPVTNFPPLYSAVLSLAGRFGLPSLDAARLLNQLFFASLIVATGLALYLATRSLWSAALGVALVVLSPSLTVQFTWAQSEPVFLSLIEFGLLAAFVYVRRRGNSWLLVLSGGLLGLAVVTRYAGIGIVLGVLCVLWAEPAIRRRQRAKETALFLPVATLPVVLFLVRNAVLAGSATNRPRPFWHPPPFATWSSGAETVLRWVLPDRLVSALGPAGSILVAAVAAIALGYLLARLAVSPPRAVKEAAASLPMARLLSGAILGYLVIVAVTVFAVDRLLPLNDRILSPVYYLLLQLVILGVTDLATSTYRLLAMGVLVTIFLGMQVVRTTALAGALRADGQGYRSRAWRESQVVRFVCSLPEVPVFSNDVPALYFACGRISFPLPWKVNAASLEPNPNYEAEVRTLEEAVQNRDGVIAILGWYGEERMDRLGATELVAGLRPYATFDDGVVFGR